MTIYYQTFRGRLIHNFARRALDKTTGLLFVHVIIVATSYNLLYKSQNLVMKYHAVVENLHFVLWGIFTTLSYSVYTLYAHSFTHSFTL